MISLEHAAELARRYVDEDPLNDQADLIPIEGYVAVVGEAAHFGFQNRAYLETGDPSLMIIGIGPVRVDLTTGECRMLGAVEAREMDLFDVDELALPGPGGWRLVPPELADAWRAAFDAEPAAPDPSAPCPRCGATDLHRWYRVEEPLDEMFDAVRAVAYGWRTEWCASCHLCHEDGDTFVPDHWQSPYDVPEAFDMRFTPRCIEAARRAKLEADTDRNG
ncbi:hypothetical protein [Streptomyces sp. NPDC057496]|uniref:hypothetical protein n=1 Tax=Streptomyces sp. NPDC057496 TaxID=3346149 RepID=UPI0036B74FDC